MKTVTAVLIIGSLLFGTSPVLAQKKKAAPDRANAGRAAQQRIGGAEMPLLNVLQGMYVSRIRQQTELSEEQFAKIIPFLNAYVRDRNEVGGPRRMRARNQLAQAINRGAPDEELEQMTEAFDRVEGEARDVQDRFHANVDPILSVRQRARLRIFLIMMEDQIRRFIQASQSGGAPPPRPNAP